LALQVRRIYCDREHRQILETIFEHRLALTEVSSRVEEAAKEYFARSYPDTKFFVEQWPVRASNPQWFGICPEPLDRYQGQSGFGVYYMFRSKKPIPFLGDSVTMLIASWGYRPVDQRRVKSLSLRLADRLPKSKSHDFDNWRKWELLWEGDTYELQDMGENDGKNLSRILKNTISKTFRSLKRAVATV
jgi:hypothetical protein